MNDFNESGATPDRITPNNFERADKDNEFLNDLLRLEFEMMDVEMIFRNRPISARCALAATDMTEKRFTEIVQLLILRGRIRRAGRGVNPSTGEAETLLYSDSRIIPGFRIGSGGQQ